MQSDRIDKLPVRVRVQELLDSRYTNGRRPASWDLRKAGQDFIKSSDGRIIKLVSDGGQSPPQKDWVILINKGDENSGYKWTLYSI